MFSVVDLRQLILFSLIPLQINPSVKTRIELFIQPQRVSHTNIISTSSTTIQILNPQHKLLESMTTWDCNIDGNNPIITSYCGQKNSISLHNFSNIRLDVSILWEVWLISKWLVIHFLKICWKCSRVTPSFFQVKKFHSQILKTNYWVYWRSVNHYNLHNLSRHDHLSTKYAHFQDFHHLQL